jgi:hypothetical protein
MCVLIFFTNLSEAVPILSIAEQGMVKYVCWSSCKTPAIRVRL